MTEPSTSGATTRVSRMIKAPRQAVYRAFLDRDAVVAWLPPRGMTGHVEIYEAHEGGKFEITLKYLDAANSPGGKTTEDTDIVRGRFLKLVPDEQIVWVVEFDSQDPAFAGNMRITFSLADADGGTDVVVVCEDIPRGVRPEDNEMGCRSSLENLAAHLE